jgi:hypothetical protein
MIKLRRMDGALSTHGRENIYVAFVGKPEALEDRRRENNNIKWVLRKEGWTV